MSVTDYPTWDGKGEDNPDDLIWCDVCGRPMGAEEHIDDWGSDDNGDMTCPHCAALAVADGLEQAERQGE